jgi:mRNA interferase YafQ
MGRMNVAQTKQFKKDVKRMRKRGKDLEKVKAVIDLLVAEEPLPPKNRDHKLGGNWIGRRDCHIEPDWILIYKLTEDELLLERTGTHSDLF